MSDDFAILLVDDSRMMRKLLREMLRMAGICRVHEADHEQDALDILKGQRIDVILSDWNVGPVNGLELLRNMRALPSLSSIPFVMMTALPSPALIADAITAGVNGYLHKPFDRSQLLRVLQLALAGRLAA